MAQGLMANLLATLKSINTQVAAIAEKPRTLQLH